MNDSNSQETGKSQENCSGGGCCSPMQCCDWKSINDRAKAVLTDPKNVWPTIKAESKTVKDIYLSYVIPLAVIGALCGLLGSIIFGGGAGFIAAIIGAVVQLTIGLGLMYVNALIYKTLAPYFDGSTDETSTFKLLAYGSTASLVGAFLSVFPPLAMLSILFSIYSLYTIYHGIPTMAGVTTKRVPYFIVCIIASIVVTMVLGGILVAVLGVGAAGSRMF